MTQQTSTCRQPAKLVWEELEADRGDGHYECEGWEAWTSFGTRYFIDIPHDRFEAIYNDGTTIPLPHDCDLEQAQDACQADYNRRWTEGSGPLKNYRHINRGTEYRLIGNAKLQTEIPLSDMADLVVYQGDDGQIWVRPEAEFFDGRFEEFWNEFMAQAGLKMKEGG